MFVLCYVVEIPGARSVQGAAADDSPWGDTASNAAQDVVQSQMRHCCFQTIKFLSVILSARDWLPTCCIMWH